jgi:hypothetical protein
LNFQKGGFAFKSYFEYPIIKFEQMFEFSKRVFASKSYFEYFVVEYIVGWGLSLKIEINRNCRFWLTKLPNRLG